MHKARILAGLGHKQKEIADFLNVSDRMVRKYLNPDYQPRSRPERPSQLDPFKPLIESILEEHPFFNLVLLRRRLVSQGYKGGMTILRTFAAQVRQQLVTKAALRFETEPGRQAQVDWKECGPWLVRGQMKKVYAFVMLLGYSRKPFVLFTDSMISPVLLAAHNRAFEFFGGVPQEILYDNMRTAWFASGTEWKVNPDLLDYSVRVGFDPKRCQVRRPQTKGKVERFIGYLGQHFLPQARQDGLTSLEELNAAIGPWLAQVDTEELGEFCETRSQRFAEEQPHLRIWVPEAAPDVRLSKDLVVSREGLVTFETNRYSVPAQYLGQIVQIRVDPLIRQADFLYNGLVLHRRALAEPGSRARIVAPEDAQSLKDRWERENRPRPRPVTPPHTPPPAPETIEVRAPSFYDQFAEASA